MIPLTLGFLAGRQSSNCGGDGVLRHGHAAESHSEEGFPAAWQVERSHHLRKCCRGTQILVMQSTQLWALLIRAGWLPVECSSAVQRQPDQQDRWSPACCMWPQHCAGDCTCHVHEMWDSSTARMHARAHASHMPFAMQGLCLHSQIWWQISQVTCRVQEAVQ